NTDRNGDDARFVIKKMSLKYPTLKAGETPKEYGVQAYPTLLILDGNGVVRDVHIGYSPKLKQELIAKIDKILSEQKRVVMNLPFTQRGRTRRRSTGGVEAVRT